MRAPSLFFLLLTLAPQTAQAVEWDLSVANRFFFRSLTPKVRNSRLRFMTETSTTASRQVAYQLHLDGHLSGRPIDEVGLTIGLDSGLVEIGNQGVLIDGRDPLDALKETLFLGRTAIDLQLGENGFVQLQAGKLRPQLGRSAIFDAYALGLMLDVDGTLLNTPTPLSGRLYALLPDATFTSAGKQSPLFDAEVTYHFDRTKRVRFFNAVMIDAGDDVSPILVEALSQGRVDEIPDAAEASVAALPAAMQAGARAAVERARRSAVTAVQNGTAGQNVQTSGFLGWTGFSGEVGFGDLEIGAVMMVGWGNLDTTSGPDAAYQAAVRQVMADFPDVADALLEAQRSEQSVDLLSYYLALDARYFLFDDLSVDIFGIAMSGDAGIPSPLANDDDARRFTGFASVAPFLPKTELFFDRSVGQHLSRPELASYAPDGGGLFAGGITAEWFILDAWRAKVAVAAMASSVTRDGYGVELGLGSDFFIADWLTASVDGAIFFPDSHFGDVPIGYQVVVSARQFFGSR